MPQCSQCERQQHSCTYQRPADVEAPEAAVRESGSGTKYMDAMVGIMQVRRSNRLGNARQATVPNLADHSLDVAQAQAEAEDQESDSGTLGCAQVRAECNENVTQTNAHHATSPAQHNQGQTSTLATEVVHFIDDDIHLHATGTTIEAGDGEVAEDIVHSGNRIIGQSAHRLALPSGSLKIEPLEQSLQSSSDVDESTDSLGSVSTDSSVHSVHYNSPQPLHRRSKRLRVQKRRLKAHHARGTFEFRKSAADLWWSESESDRSPFQPHNERATIMSDSRYMRKYPGSRESDSAESDSPWEDDYDKSNDSSFSSGSVYQSSFEWTEEFKNVKPAQSGSHKVKEISRKRKRKRPHPESQSKHEKCTRSRKRGILCDGEVPQCSSSATGQGKNALAVSHGQGKMQLVQARPSRSPAVSPSWLAI